uniref:Uncharacterized protein n=1 Tax=Arundo donax TaxID=35708 RepID=A0A0A9HPM2_ARUDO
MRKHLFCRQQDCHRWPQMFSPLLLMTPSLWMKLLHHPHAMAILLVAVFYHVSTTTIFPYSLAKVMSD